MGSSVDLLKQHLGRLDRSLSARDFASYIACPSAFAPRYARRLVDAGLSYVGPHDIAVACDILADMADDILAAEVRDASALGLQPRAIPFIQRTGSALVRIAASGGSRLAAGAPICSRCGAPMRAGVKAAGNLPVYYCAVDRVVQMDDSSAANA